MTSTPKGPIDYPIGGLTPDQFEALVFLLAREEFPEVVRVRVRDHGLDARRPDPSGATLRGWQAKRFADKINWTQCEESMRRAAAFWRPPRVTFAFPKVLSAKEQAKFRTHLIEKFPRVHIDWWDGDELQARIRDTEGGRRAVAWLFDNLEETEEKMRRALAVGGELADAHQAAKRVAEVQNYVDRDPHLRYTIVSADEDAPHTPPAAGTIISFEAKFGLKRVRFDGTERYPGAAADAGIEGRLLFSDDEDGRRAREALDQATQSGDSVTIHSGVQAGFDRVPVGLRGLLPEGSTGGTIELQPALATVPTPQVEPSTISVLVRSGTAELGVVLTPVEPPPGQTGLLIGSAGGFELRLEFHGEPGEGKIAMSWRWQRGEGNALEQLLAAQLLLSAHQGEPVEIYDPGFDRVVVSSVIDEPDGLAARIEELGQMVAYLGFVNEVEAWVGAPLYPPASPTDEDAKVLAELIGRVRNPKVEGTWDRLELTMANRPEHEVFVLALVRPIYAPLFGETRYVGGELLAVPEARLDPNSADAKVGETIAVIPGEDDSVSVVFERPADAPEDALRLR
jgi:hypothetical protein